MAYTPVVEVLQRAQQVVDNGTVRSHASGVRHDLVQHHHKVSDNLRFMWTDGVFKGRG